MELYSHGDTESIGTTATELDSTLDRAETIKVLVQIGLSRSITLRTKGQSALSKFQSWNLFLDLKHTDSMIGTFDYDSVVCPLLSSCLSERGQSGLKL